MIALAPGDAFEVNGRFACVVHTAKTKAIIRVMNDEVPYTVTRVLAETLVQAFKTDPRVRVVIG
jgi:spore coat polysaccharide biosynthesis protein SpsF (cytidylyltransferase family)